MLQYKKIRLKFGELTSAKLSVRLSDALRSPSAYTCMLSVHFRDGRAHVLQLDKPCSLDVQLGEERWDFWRDVIGETGDLEHWQGGVIKGVGLWLNSTDLHVPACSWCPPPPGAVTKNEQKKKMETVHSQRMHELTNLNSYLTLTARTCRPKLHADLLYERCYSNYNCCPNCYHFHIGIDPFGAWSGSRGKKKWEKFITKR